MSCRRGSRPSRPSPPSSRRPVLQPLRLFRHPHPFGPPAALDQAPVRRRLRQRPEGEGRAGRPRRLDGDWRRVRRQDHRRDREGALPGRRSFRAKVDKEVTTFTASIHKGTTPSLPRSGPPQLLSPGLREEDFRRLKDAGKNALLQDLRETNEEELAKERLQANIFAGTPTATPSPAPPRGSTPSRSTTSAAT